MPGRLDTLTEPTIGNEVTLLSVVIPAMKKTVWPLLAAVLCIGALAGLWLFAADRVSIGADRGSVKDAVIPQAKWEVKAYTAPNPGGITEEDRAVFLREKDGVVGAIQRLYEALFLQPAAADRTVRATLTPAASKILAGSRIGLHDQVEDVRTTARFVKVGIQVDDGLRAAAVVRVEAEALRKSSPIEVWHRAKLWMEKVDGKWKVVAFDAEQGRLN